jgi:hypothetical protein
MALATEGRRDPAVYEMTRVLRMGLPAGFRRTFLDEGTLALSLIEDVQQSSARNDPILGPHLEQLAQWPAAMGIDASPTIAPARGTCGRS